MNRRPDAVRRERVEQGWLLDWARSYVSAWVSERVSADLRQRTYAHLQQLSLEFFGAKRTGDLMSRISSDTDRLCNFRTSGAHQSS